MPRPQLTWTLGLRWDYIGYPTSPQQGGIANFNFTNTDTIISNFGNSSSTANVNQNYGDFGPRVGFAWMAFKNTVIRAGWGRSFTNGFDGANFGAITNDWPNATRQDYIASRRPLSALAHPGRGPADFCQRL